MSSVSRTEQIREIYDFALQKGFTEDLFFCADNVDRYIDTAIRAFRDYPLFRHVFGGKYDETVLRRMLAVDFRSRVNNLAGFTGSSNFESVLLIEPPGTKRPGWLAYVKAAEPVSYTLLFKPAMYRLEDFEKYAMEKRRPWQEDKTWYLYIFATREELQRQGYGKKLMTLVTSFADRKSCRICLETNDPDNVGMYEHFGYHKMDTSAYEGTLGHFVMLYGADAV